MSGEYEKQKALYLKLMAELSEENRRQPMPTDELARRMSKIYATAFPPPVFNGVSNLRVQLSSKIT